MPFLNALVNGIYKIVEKMQIIMRKLKKKIIETVFSNQRGLRKTNGDQNKMI